MKCLLCFLIVLSIAAIGCDTDNPMVQQVVDPEPIVAPEPVVDPEPVIDPEPVEDPYAPLANFHLENDGTITLLLGNFHMRAGAGGGCIKGIANFNGVKQGVHWSAWQHRKNADEPWQDVPNSRKDGLCGAVPPEIPGQYRIIAEITRDGVKGKYSTENILIVE